MGWCSCAERAEARRRPRLLGRHDPGRSQDLARLGALVEQGLLRPLVDTVLPLEQAAQAHRRAEGSAVGEVGLAMA